VKPLALPSALRSSRRVLEVVNPEAAPEARMVEGVRLEPGWACLFLWENGGPWKQHGEPYRFDSATFVHREADLRMMLPYAAGPTIAIKREERQ